MTRWQKYSFAGLSAILAVSGGTYFWMKYLMQTDDPFAVVNHPLQPAMLHVHVLAAPAFLIVFGVLFNAHIVKRIGSPVPNRGSGLIALVTIGVMTVSGYLLEVVTTEAWRRVYLVAHLASGAVFVVAYVSHLLISLSVLATTRRSADRTAA